MRLGSIYQRIIKNQNGVVMNKVLIISPHPDDEVLGCFSFLEDSIVSYITTAHPLCKKGENEAEMLKLAERMKFQPIISPYKESVNILPKIAFTVLITYLESLIDTQSPHTVLIPNPSYNQDHRAVYDAALTAMRHHDTNHFVKRILLYEEPETWDTMRKPEPFKANYFRSIDIDAKLKAVKVYQSQLRGHRSLDYIQAIAKVRGQQANVDYAEAFEVVRWVE